MQAAAAAAAGFLLLLLCGGKSLSSTTHLDFNSEIRHVAVGKEKLFVATDSQIFQMRHDLSVEKIRNLTSSSSDPDSVSILLPFQANGTLVMCGTSGCSYCEVLNITDITQRIYLEKPASGPWENESSVSFMVDFSDGSDEGSYMLVGRRNHVDQKPINKDCSTIVGVKLYSTLDSQPGNIFAENDHSATPEFRALGDNKVNWIDGFQTSSRRHSFLFGNILNFTKTEKVKAFLLKMENNVIKSKMLESTRGALLQCCQDKDRSELLSSAVISSDSSLIWTGIFSARTDVDPENTAVVLYKVPLEKLNGSIKDTALPEDAVLFKHNSLTAVAAEHRGTLTVLYMGTANGQLMKLVLNEDYTPGCATVLYRSDDDQKVSPKMYFHPDHNSIFIILGRQLMRLSVMQCEKYNTLNECIMGKEQFCGWCVDVSRCSVRDQCSNSSWISVPEESFQKQLLSFKVSRFADEVNLRLHLNLKATQNHKYTCDVMKGRENLCTNKTALFPNCSCSFPDKFLPPNETRESVSVGFSIGTQTLTETLTLRNCKNIKYTSLYSSCAACVSAGCHWNSDSGNCFWAPEYAPHMDVQETCKHISLEKKYEPEISESSQLIRVSFAGKNNFVINGKNLESVVKIRFQSSQSCSMKEVPVLRRSNDSLTFHIPSGNKENVEVCVVTEDGQCYGKATVSYYSLPMCRTLEPHVSWISGGRKVNLKGKDLEYGDEVTVNSASITRKTLMNQKPEFWFSTPAMRTASEAHGVSVVIGNSTLVNCAVSLTYHPDPEFTSFSTNKEASGVRVILKKKEDMLNLTSDDLDVWGELMGQRYNCEVTNLLPSVVNCRIKETDIEKVDVIHVRFGNRTVTLTAASTNMSYLYILILIILLILGALTGVYIIRKHQRKMNEQMNERVELIETQIRNEIRQGFVDLQTEKADLVENISTIPYLDYKHFALKTFFPEGSIFAASIIKDVGQDAVMAEMDEKSQAFAALIRKQTFLTSFVHALEEQKSFSIKDKCAVASLLTVALQSDLLYLTELMEVLLQSLMEQPSNAQPKLLLRRTESIVEKLLTNWMSVCLYGFLRETVGQHLFLLVSALSQQISQGPVDAVTGKALYTLNEDWLLWQAQDFSSLKLKVLFAVGTEGEVSEPLEVSVLTCDTVEQVKEKILQTFQRKFGFPYTQQLTEIDIEYEKAGVYVPLDEVGGISAVQGEVTMLNTLSHFNIPDEACIKVITKKLHAPLKKQTSLRDDQNFCTKYFHLIDPDDDLDQSNHPERKKLKLKEVYLTKLLSTKVAVHSFVEDLFRSIWGMPNNRAPVAVKYFFDFLDEQAEKKKISDPDVLHIWKTNSVPLRFWVNILKNPNFVFSDLEKTPHLDACLSVIAQAFMDSFSLSDHQLGKHSPTNKLLYAKEIPKYKQEVKTYYKLVRDQPSMSSQEFKFFLLEESKKHENELKESAALQELYKYMQRYHSEIVQKLEESEETSVLKEELDQVKQLYENRSRTTWN